MSREIDKIMENMCTIPEASEVVKISQKTLRNWRSSGKYPALFVKIGGRVLVDLSEFTRMIERQRVRNTN